MSPLSIYAHIGTIYITILKWYKMLRLECFWLKITTDPVGTMSALCTAKLDNLFSIIQNL